VPTLDETVHLYPDLCPPDLLESHTSATGTQDNGDGAKNFDNQYYFTQRGDTLFDIARRQLGQASRYLEILRMNRGQLPSNVDHLSRLKQGLKLRLPN
jgi:nucleoid-associated protein YgaU